MHEHEHEHEHEHTDPCHADEHCAACVYISQRVGIEVHILTFFSPDFCISEPQFYEVPCLPLRLTVTKRSRAPPIFSDERSNL